MQFCLTCQKGRSMMKFTLWPNLSEKQRADQWLKLAPPCKETLKLKILGLIHMIHKATKGKIIHIKKTKKRRRPLPQNRTILRHQMVRISITLKTIVSKVDLQLQGLAPLMPREDQEVVQDRPLTRGMVSIPHNMENRTLIPTAMLFGSLAWAPLESSLCWHSLPLVCN